MSENSNPFRWAVVILLVLLNVSAYQNWQESKRGWLRQVEETRNSNTALTRLDTTLNEMAVESQLHREREAHHWRTHPGDRVIPGPGRGGRGIGEPFGSPPLTEPEPTVAEEFRDAHDEGEDDAP